jgi:DNA-binding NarL/FixJ family response regulator
MAGLQVIGEAEDGSEAVRKAEELKPDLVILDIGISKLNGIDVCRAIHKSIPESKVVFVTAHSDPDMVLAALDAGALGYVHKSRTALDLKSAVRAALSGKRFFSCNVKVPVSTQPHYPRKTENPKTSGQRMESKRDYHKSHVAPASS